MNSFLEILICILIGVYGHKLLKQKGIAGKHITGLVLLATLALFVYFPLFFNDVDNPDEPTVLKDDLGRHLTNEEVYDGLTITFRVLIAFMIAFFGGIGILIS